MALIPFELRDNVKPLGLKGRDGFDGRDWDFDKLALPAFTGDGTIDLTEHMPPVFSQMNSSSCVAQAIAAAIYGREHFAGLSPEVPSRLSIYYFGRFLRGLQNFDSGMYLRDAVEALRRYGVPDERFWPFGSFTTTINKRPSIESMGQGHARHGGKYVRIRDLGAARLKAIDAALFANYPVAFGTGVSKNFMRSEGAEVIGAEDVRTGTLAGRHAMLIVGRQVTGGQLLYLVRNSWGPRWRKDGYVYLTDSYIEDGYSDDFQIIYGWKKLQEAA